MSEHECDECDKDFDSEKEKLEHELEEHKDELSSHGRDDKKQRLNKLKQKQNSRKQDRKKKLKMAAAGVIGLAVVTLVAFQALSFLKAAGPVRNQSIGVGVPVHWHADYRIYVCGEERIVSGGPILAHTHGEKTFHLEGVRKRKEQATLGWIMGQLSQGEFNSTHVFGQTTCGGEPANLTVKVNGQKIENPENYIVRDRDRIVIRLEQT
ncbi:MAG: hypothetical protein ABEJ36_01290 [Candidatus Nanosalina sp.]